MGGLLALLLGLVCALDVRASLPPGISGAWYNPAQSGHGLTLQRLDDGRVLGFWFVYDPEGNPVHLYLDGRIADRAIVAEAWHSSGMRFGTFPPSDHRMQRWGDVEITFADCDNAQLNWVPDGAFEHWRAGGMTLVRLTRVAGLTCDFDGDDSVSSLPAGSYSGQWDRDLGAYEAGRPYPLHVAVDREGGLWAATNFNARTPLLWLAPTPTFIGVPGAVAAQGTAVLQVRSAMAMVLDARPLPLQTYELPLAFALDGNGQPFAETQTAIAPNLVRWLRIGRDVGANDPLMQPGYDFSRLAGRTFLGRTPPALMTGSVVVRFVSHGRFCIDDRGDCRLWGRVLAFEAGMSMFSFELERQDVPGVVYRGKGWVDEAEGLLVLVGAAGDEGLGLAGYDAAR